MMQPYKPICAINDADGGYTLPDNYPDQDIWNLVGFSPVILETDNFFGVAAEWALTDEEESFMFRLGNIALEYAEMITYRRFEKIHGKPSEEMIFPSKPVVVGYVPEIQQS